MTDWTLDVDHPIHGQRRVRRFHHRGNGLTALLLADDSAPVLSYQTWFGVGSADERPGKTGLAHFFEHLMFTQTRTYGAGELDRMIESCGGDTNAATWLDWTYYSNNVPASELDTIAMLEADRMVNLDLSVDVVEAEREVIINERRERVDDDIDGFLDEMLMADCFGDHPYGWPTIGWMADIQGLTIPDLEAFYRRYYTPDNATVVVVGDIDEQHVLSVLSRTYGGIAASGQRAQPGGPAPHRPPHRRTVPKPVAADRALFGWAVPGQNTREWAVLELAAHLLAGGPSSPLYRGLVIDRESASSVSCTALPLARSGFFELSIHASDPGGIGPCERVVDDVLADLAARPWTATDIDKARAGMLTDFWSDLTTADGKAESLGHHELVCGDFRTLFTFPTTVESITADEIRTACATYLRPADKHAAIAVPE